MNKKEKKRVKKVLMDCIDESMNAMKNKRPDCDLMREIANLVKVIKKL